MYTLSIFITEAFATRALVHLLVTCPDVFIQGQVNLTFYATIQS